MNKDNHTLFITERPCDAFLEIKKYTSIHVIDRYLQKLLTVNFDVLDCGNFTLLKDFLQENILLEIIKSLDKSNSNTKISISVYSIDEAVILSKIKNIDILSLPFLNQKDSFDSKKFELAKEIKQVTNHYLKELFIYLPFSMEMHKDSLLFYIEKFASVGIKNFKLIETSSMETSPLLIEKNITAFRDKFPEIHFGIHFHINKEDNWHDKINAAYSGGCRHFDSSIHGRGRFSLLDSKDIHNISTENLINFAQLNKLNHKLNITNFEGAFNNSLTLFSN